MRHGQSQFLGRLTDLVCRHAYLVLAIWIVLAAGLNLAAPRLEQVVFQKSGPFIPDSAPSLVTIKNMGIQFGESQASAIGYLVLENERGFNDADRKYITTKSSPSFGPKSHRSIRFGISSTDPATAHIAASQGSGVVD